MCHDTSKLDPLVAEYDSLKQSATDLVDNYISLKRRGKKIKVKKVGGRVGCAGSRGGRWWGVGCLVDSYTSPKRRGKKVKVKKV